jgi:CheY-like chemotaxis protein
MPYTILLVEDTDDTREFMRFLLELNGYKVIEARNGAEAVKYSRQTHTDLILMDMALPIMDGISATRKIRKQDETKNIPIIAITAFGISYYEEALQAGCNEVIGKPVNSSSLKTAIGKYLTS